MNRVAVVRLIRVGALPDHGFLNQQGIPLDAYLATRDGGRYNAEG